MRSGPSSPSRSSRDSPGWTLAVFRGGCRPPAAALARRCSRSCSGCRRCWPSPPTSTSACFATAATSTSGTSTTTTSAPSTRRSWATRNLYGATLAADRETGLRYQPAARRDARSGDGAGCATSRSVAAEAPRYRGRFREARWREFVADITWFKMQLPEHRWSLILADHGYNGTPAWSFVVGGLLTRHLSVRQSRLTLGDAACSIRCCSSAAMVAVAWAFGTRAALLTVIFIGTHYLLSWGHLKGALLRTDFAMCSLLAVCLVKKGRYKHRRGASRLGHPVAHLSRVPAAWSRGSCSCAVSGAPAVSIASSLGLFLAGGVTVGLVGARLVRLLRRHRTSGSEWSEKIALHYADGSDWDLGATGPSPRRASSHGVPMRRATLALVSGQAAASALHPVEIVVHLAAGPTRADLRARARAPRGPGLRLRLRLPLQHRDLLLLPHPLRAAGLLRRGPRAAQRARRGLHVLDRRLRLPVVQPAGNPCARRGCSSTVGGRPSRPTSS